MTRTAPRSLIRCLHNSSSVRIGGASSENVFGWTNGWMYCLAFLLKVIFLSVSWRPKVGRIIEYQANYVQCKYLVNTRDIVQ